MSFLYSSLLWIGLPLVGVPLLIHLINMLRHRRVQWAAMEFLLQSQRKHRTWIILKQLLLLLLRTAAVAAVVLMVAQPVLRGQWGSLIGGAKTHHIVLLDDSFSMSDRWADTSAFDEAKSVVSRLAGLAGRQDSAQTFTLLRFSRASRLAKGTQPDLLQKSLDAEFSALLTSTLAGMQPSETAAGPNDALEAIDRLPSKTEDENRVVYLVSDFRAIQWDDPVVLRKTLSRLDESGAQVRLVNCVDAARPNLAISALRAGPGTRAAGVPLMMDVAVKNFGTTVAKDVSVALGEDGNARPAVVFEEIPPGRAATRRFPVQFSAAGEHQIAASLQSDAVAADNVRYAVIDFPAAVSVLVIDGDPKAQDAYFLTSALSPGGKINSGLKALVETPRYLRNHDLGGFAAVYLLNIERLDPAEIQVLEDYVQAGGGVAFFLGELSRGDFFTKSLYRDGAGMFPLPLTQSTQLLVDRLDKAPDLEVTAHPIFSVFSGERNSFINTVTIERYFGAPKDWAPDPESTTKVIAKLRNGAPLAVERKFGEGRVVAILTKAAPVNTTQGVWNNWGRNNPSFVVAMLELQAYLSAPGQADTSRLVGTPLEIEFSAAQYQPVVRFVMPQEKQGGALSIDASAAGQSDPSKQGADEEKDAKRTPATTGELTATLTDTDASGIYEAQLTATSGTPESRRFAYNVEPEEGDLRVLDGQQLATRLAGIRYQYQLAKDLNYDPQQLAGFNLGESMLYVLVAILLGEQVLSYFMSYHPPRIGRATT